MCEHLIRIKTPIAVFVVVEQPHSIYKRERDDLIYMHHLSLKQALTGFDISLEMIDGRKLDLSMQDRIVGPTSEEIVPQGGMPVPNQPGMRGNLRIRFDIEFPLELDSHQKDMILQALS